MSAQEPTGHTMLSTLTVCVSPDAPLESRVFDLDTLLDAAIRAADAMGMEADGIEGWWPMYYTLRLARAASSALARDVESLARHANA